jgi:hypothetical protein
LGVAGWRLQPKISEFPHFLISALFWLNICLTMDYPSFESRFKELVDGCPVTGWFLF